MRDDRGTRILIGNILTQCQKKGFKEEKRNCFSFDFICIFLSNEINSINQNQKSSINSHTFNSYLKV